MASEQGLQEKFEEARDAYQADQSPENRAAMEHAMEEFQKVRHQRKALEAVDSSHPRSAGTHNVEAEGDN